jgi:hypothetical protein
VVWFLQIFSPNSSMYLSPPSPYVPHALPIQFFKFYKYLRFRKASREY